MPTECRPDLFGFEPVEGREVVAAFDAGAITSDAGALLLGATDRAVRMMDRFASCFHDERRADLIEHEVATLVGQRVFGIALGYEDLNDHDELRHDPLLAVLAGKLEARREDCAPVAGKSTLNRLELSCCNLTLGGRGAARRRSRARAARRRDAGQSQTRQKHEETGGAASSRQGPSRRAARATATPRATEGRGRQETAGASRAKNGAPEIERRGSCESSRPATVSNEEKASRISPRRRGGAARSRQTKKRRSAEPRAQTAGLTRHSRRPEKPRREGEPGESRAKPRYARADTSRGNRRAAASISRLIDTTASASPSETQDPDHRSGDERPRCRLEEHGSVTRGDRSRHGERNPEHTKELYLAIENDHPAPRRKALKPTDRESPQDRLKSLSRASARRCTGRRRVQTDLDR